MVDLATYDPSIEAQAQDSAGDPMPGATLSFWTARTGGTQIVQVYESDGATLVAGGTLTADSFGFLPRQIKIDRTAYPEVWVDGGGGDRVRLMPSDMDSRIISLQASVDSLTATINAMQGQYGVPQLGSDGLVLSTQLPSFATQADIASVQTDVQNYKDTTASLSDVGFEGAILGAIDRSTGPTTRLTAAATGGGGLLVPLRIVGRKPRQLISLSLEFAGTVAASDTDFWTIIVRKLVGDPYTTVDVVTKTTKLTGGEGITTRKGWNLDAYPFASPASQFTSTGNVSDRIAINFAATGSPADLVFPMVIEWDFNAL